MKRPAPPLILCATAAGRILEFTCNAGEGLPAHRHPQMQVCVTVLSGQLTVTRDTATVLSAGQSEVFDGDTLTALSATQPSRFLVTLLSSTLSPSSTGA